MDIEERTEEIEKFLVDHAILPTLDLVGKFKMVASCQLDTIWDNLDTNEKDDLRKDIYQVLAQYDLPPEEVLQVLQEIIEDYE